MAKGTEEKTKEMSRFILSKLDQDSYSLHHKVFPGFPEMGTDYIKSDSGLILLINSSYTEREFEFLIEQAKKQNPKTHNFAFIFYKDGKNYFRSAAFTDQTDLESIRRKTGKTGTLRKYSLEDLKRAITLAMPERRMLNAGVRISYYQPETERLEENLLTYFFTPLIFDREYSRTGFGPEIEPSSRYYQWFKRLEHRGNILPDLRMLRTDNDVVRDDYHNTPQ